MGARRVVSGAGVMLVSSLLVCSPARAQTTSALPGTPAAKPHAKPRTPSTICPAPAKAAFSIEALHEPVDVAMNFTLPEIIGLAEQSGWTGNHTPLGFSIAKTGYSVSLVVDAAAETACSEPIQASIIIKLMDRHIEVAKELARDPSCLAAAQHHYVLHAASNDATLTHFAEELSPVLSRLILPNLQHDPARADEDRGRIDQVIRTAIDRVWPSLSVAMRAAAKGMDTPDEIAGLVQACRPLIDVAPSLKTGIEL